MSSEARNYGSPETRVRILDAAWRLLEEKGTDVRIADVAEAAAVSRQAVYLHFGDRTGLLTALVDHVDLSQGSVRLRANIFGAPSGVESLRRWVETMSWYMDKIDAVTRVLESGQYTDEALAAAWRDRMGRRRDDIIRRIMERIAEDGRLGQGWSVEDAIDLVYVVTMPGPWRELTRELEWTPERYAKRVWALLERSLIAKSS